MPDETQTPAEKILNEPPKSHIHRNASWGAIISIVIILAMIVIGALYSWGHRISQQPTEASTAITE